MRQTGVSSRGRGKCRGTSSSSKRGGGVARTSKVIRAVGSGGGGKQFWSLASPVHKQAVEAIARLLAAKSERR
eukprot:scaffold415147_cov38-Prasinocladus_malaysianus.AAC.1